MNDLLFYFICQIINIFNDVRIQLKSIVFYLFCLQLIQVNGQQEVIFSQYMFNHQSLNPGYSGSKEYTNFTILHRSQWLNFDGAPESQAFYL